MQTGLDVFDTTLQKTNLWLKELMDALGWDDRHKTYEGLRVTLHTLRDRLPVVEAAHLGAQLPLLLRGVYYDGWDPSSVPHKERHTEGFLAPIRQRFSRSREPVDAEQVARAVFKVLAHHVSAGEIAAIHHLLPRELQAFWATAAAD